MRYLGRNLVLDTSKPKEFEGYLIADHSQTVVSYKSDAPPVVRIAKSVHREIQVFYTETDGCFVRTSTSPATEVTVATITDGSYWIFSDEDRTALTRGQGRMRLPGEFNVQGAKDVKGFTLRLPIDESTLFLIRAWPWHRRLQFKSRLEPDEAEDLIRLQQFYCLEHERLEKQGPGWDRAQLNVVARALRDRFMEMLVSRVKLAPHVDSEMLGICMRVDDFLRNYPQGGSTGELANAGMCSIRQMYRAFAEIAESTPREYEIRTRLQLVRQSLLEGMYESVDLQQIAHRYGFTNKSGMLKHYRNEYGETFDDTLETFREIHRTLLRECLP